MAEKNMKPTKEQEAQMKAILKKVAARKATGTPTKRQEKGRKIDVYFNGKLIFQTTEPEKLVEGIRKKRRMSLIPNQVNCAYHPVFKEIRINTEHGRARRPLVIVENGKPRLTKEHMDKMLKGEITFSYLVQHGIVEHIDAEEEENTLIAIDEESVTKDHTHMEINPITILGMAASLIPYPEYNRGDRINYGAKMVGQAIGTTALNFPMRTDTKFNVMAYPQTPLVKTSVTNVLEDYPGGQNVVVAVMCYDGFNLNDAVIINKSSADRGLFRSFYFRTYETIKERYWGGQEDEICIPEPGIKGHRGEDAYKDLGEDGIINPETGVASDSVLVGKVSPLRFLSSEEFTADIENRRETSATIRYGEEGIIDDVILSETLDADQLIKIRVRDERGLEPGDKLASRHGQKGIISLLVPQEDMPFTNDGIVPDVIFNPHAIPSRMTVGQLLELLTGKTAAYTGNKIDSSAFNHMNEVEIRKMLGKAGFRDDGKQTMYDGKTGKKYDVMIFTGLSYYLKLDHMVADKIHARSRGPVTLLTKQPTEGRAKRGGLRLGEMEQQCLIGHGAALTLKERFDSDKTLIPICEKCGMIAIHDTIKNRSYCPVCKDSTTAWVETSYAFKLMLDEIKSMGIFPKMGVEEI
jgi:DNA-directed RNA polymerase subunit B'